MTEKRTIRSAALLGTLMLLAPLAGCLQIETRIKLDVDGSATITERVRFSPELLDLDKTAEADLRVGPLLEKAAFLDRLEHLGEGVKLVSHEVRDAPKGAREAVAVFKIPDIRNLRYASPFAAVGGYASPPRNVIAFNLFETPKDTWYGRRAGNLAVTVKAVGEAPPKPKPKEGQKPSPGPTPQQLQVLRDLQPVFRDVMRDLHVKLTFECYAPLRFRQYYRYRGMRAATHEFSLIDFAHDDLDNYGYRFIENEEILLELLRGQVGGSNVRAHTKEHATNLTLPVYHPGGVPEIYFRPSKALFERHYIDEKTGKPKTLTPDERRGKPRPADFKRDGWSDDYQTRDKDKEDAEKADADKDKK